MTTLQGNQLINFRQKPLDKYTHKVQKFKREYYRHAFL